jgi:hypothetical protein
LAPQTGFESRIFRLTAMPATIGTRPLFPTSAFFLPTALQIAGAREPQAERRILTIRPSPARLRQTQRVNHRHRARPEALRGFPRNGRRPVREQSRRSVARDDRLSDGKSFQCVDVRCRADARFRAGAGTSAIKEGINAFMLCSGRCGRKALTENETNLSLLLATLAGTRSELPPPLKNRTC